MTSLEWTAVVQALHMHNLSKPNCVGKPLPGGPLPPDEFKGLSSAAIVSHDVTAHALADPEVMRAHIRGKNLRRRKAADCLCFVEFRSAESLAAVVELKGGRSFPTINEAKTQAWHSTDDCKEFFRRVPVGSQVQFVHALKRDPRVVDIEKERQEFVRRWPEAHMVDGMDELLEVLEGAAAIGL